MTDRVLSPRMGVTIRDFEPDDQGFLSDMQYEALFVPSGEAPPDRAVLDTPGLSRYHAGLGGRPGDLGAIAVGADGARLGAVWARLVPGGYGFVDDGVPELGIAVVTGRRGEGVGGRLLAWLLERVDRCSLSVDDRNPAMRLYERTGFRFVRRDGDHAVVMAWERTS